MHFSFVITAKALYCLSQIGDIYYELGDYQEAVESYSYAIKLKPCDALIYNKHSTARSALEDYQGAINDLQKAMHPNILETNASNNFLSYLHVLAYISQTGEKLKTIAPEIASAFQKGFLDAALS